MTPELEKRINAMSMIIYLKLVKEKPWSDADVLIYNQAIKDLNIKT